MVALVAKDEAQLRQLAETLTRSGLPHHTIIESDPPYTDQAMAIGIPPMERKHLKRYLSEFPLLK